MRDGIIRKSMQKVVPKRGVQIIDHVLHSALHVKATHLMVL